MTNIKLLKKANFESEKREVLQRVTSILGDESKAILWLSTQNYSLGNLMPITLLKIGKYDKVISFIKSMEIEND